MVKSLPSVLAILTGLAAVFAPQIQDVVSAHPAVASVLGALAVIAAHFAPPPHQ